MMPSTPGTVRAARRPHGWRAPGPAPLAPADRPELWPRSGEDLCYLTGDWRILQPTRGHRWSLDDLVTAWWAAQRCTPTPPRRIADLGCGIGAVLLMLAWRFPLARGVGVEAQAASVALARRSAAWNGVAQRCDVRLGDLRDAAVFPAGARFDLITGTPPYVPRGSGGEPTRALQAACHIEQRGGIEAYCRSAAPRLADGGSFVVCHAAAQVPRAERAAAAAGLAIAHRLDVVPRAGKAALFSVYAMHRAPPGQRSTVSTLVVRDRDGQWTAAFRALRSDMGMPDSRAGAPAAAGDRN